MAETFARGSHRPKKTKIEGGIRGYVEKHISYKTMDKIAFLEANNLIFERTKELFKEKIEEGAVLVCQVGVKTLVQEAEKLVEQGADAIIARGGTYQDLSCTNLGIPVIRLVISASDILLSLNFAAKEYKKVKLVLHKSINFDPEDYKDLIHIEVECYRYGHLDELVEILNHLQTDTDSVVVGSGAIRELLVQNHLNFINIMVQTTTLMDTYMEAQRLLRQIRSEAHKANLLESVLYNIQDGVVIISMSGEILHFNRKSEELLTLKGKDVLNQNIQKIFPDFSVDQYQHLKSGENTKKIIRMKDRNVAVSVSLFLPEDSEKQIILTLHNINEIQQMERHIRYVMAKKGLIAEYRFEDIQTQSENMKAVIEQAKRISKFDGTVLIYGKSGTGKELFAQSIHNYSRRWNGPFVAVNCAAISESLLESELFGYVGGAFTGARKEGKVGMFELAHKGTIFLDEINSMSPSVQSKILRVIEQHEVMRVGSDYIIPLDVRIIAASNKALDKNVKEGGFRQDLYFRLNTFELHIPSLNQRKGDILYLFRKFLGEYSGAEPDQIVIPPEFVALLESHNWWGNVRELRSVALRYHAFYGDNSKQEILRIDQTDSPSLLTEDMKIDLKQLDKTIEQLVIQSLLNQNMSKSDIAKALGISRQALFKKMNL